MADTKNPAQGRAFDFPGSGGVICAVPTVRTHKWVDEYIDSGGNIEFVVADTLSHFKPCDYVPYLQEAAVWLQDEVWE